MTVVLDNKTLNFAGDLTFETVQVFFEQALALMAEIESRKLECVHVNFSLVEKVDTSSLSLCIELEKALQAVRSSVKYSNVPAEMLTIAQSVGMDALFDNKIIS